MLGISAEFLPRGAVLVLEYFCCYVRVAFNGGAVFVCFVLFCFCFCFIFIWMRYLKVAKNLLVHHAT